PLVPGLLGALSRLGGRAGLGLGRLALAAAAATLRTLAALAAATARGALRGLLGLALGAGGRGVALVDPHLDADAAERGAGLEEAVVDVGAEGVQRHAALAVELRPAHLGAAERSGEHTSELQSRAN